MRYLHNHLALGGVSIAVAAAVAASPVAAAETREEQANRQVVLDFYAALRRAEDSGTIRQSIQDIADQYISPDYVQHSETFRNLPGPGSERDRLIRMFQSRPPRPPEQASMGPQKQIAIMAQGDLVMMLVSRDLADPATGMVRPVYIFNMFRVKGGKLVEHWDVMPASLGMPPSVVAPVEPSPAKSPRSLDAPMER